MSHIVSRLDVGGEEFQANVAFMQAYVGKVRTIENNILLSEEKYRERANRRGKLLPRERLAHLLDPGAPFVELCSIAGFRMDGDKDGSTAGGNIVIGVGFVMIVSPTNASAIMGKLAKAGERCWKLGTVRKGGEVVDLPRQRRAAPQE